MKNNKAFGVAIICLLLLSLAVAPSGSILAADRCVTTTIQAAIDVANDGDVIHIATGTYTENITIDKSITLQGGWSANCSACISTDPADTVIDGGGNNRVITINGSYNVTIEGLTLRNGNATGQGGGFEGKDSGGGIYAHDATVTIENCDITNNSGAWDGGGIFLWNCDVTLSNNHIYENQASNGAGLYLYQSDGAELTGNQIHNNTADWFAGGGLSLNDSDATLDTNNVYSNEAVDLAGGLAMANSNVSFTNNTFSSNTAGGQGGGLHLWYGSAIFDGDTIQENTAGGEGGGLYSIGSMLTMSHVNITGNTASNTGLAKGGGAYLESLADGSQITDCTIKDNLAAGDAGITERSFGGGLYVLSSIGLTVTDNSIEGNIASLGDEGQGGGVYASGSTMNFNSNEVLSNTAGSNWGAGGGLYLDSVHGQVNGNIIQGNIGGQSGSGNGGGAFIMMSDATVQDNTISGNTASQTGDYGHGGGLDIFASSLTLSANSIIGNKASGDGATTEWGGGLFVNTAFGDIATNLVNNIVAQNEATDGAGIYILNWGSGYAANFGANLYHNTIAANNGDGIECVGSLSHKITLAMTNDIVSGHSTGISTTSGVNATIDHALFFDNTNDGIVGSNPVYGDPAFVGGENYHITDTSAAIDAGVDAGITTDIDGQTRPQGAGYDVGADEHFPGIAVTPMNLDFGDVTVGEDSAPQEVTITNNGDADLTINSISITGADASEFSQTNDCPGTLSPGANCTVNVTFSPNSEGGKSANLVIQYRGRSGGVLFMGARNVPLGGTGVVSLPPPVGVGGEAYPVNKLGVLAPWIVLAVLLVSGMSWFMLMRRRA